MKSSHLTFIIFIPLLLASCLGLPEYDLPNDKKLKLKDGQKLIYQNESNEYDTFYIHNLVHDYSNKDDYYELYEYFNVVFTNYCDPKYDKCREDCKSDFDDCLFYAEGYNKGDSCRMLGNACSKKCQLSNGKQPWETEIVTSAKNYIFVSWKYDLYIGKNELYDTLRNIEIGNNLYKEIYHFKIDSSLLEEEDITELFMSYQYGIVKYIDINSESWELIDIQEIK